MGFEPTIAAGERPQTYGLDRAATGTGSWQPYRLRVKYIDANNTKVGEMKASRSEEIHWVCCLSVR
jgi:hypothetical protein